MILSDTITLIELHYLPSIEYFTCLHTYDTIHLEVQENFIKQTFRNRCYILGANGVLSLTVPVIGGRKKFLIKDIKIDYGQNWLNVHNRAISSAYGRAPFYEYYKDYFETAFLKRDKYLFDLNLSLLTLCLKLLNLKPQIEITKTYQKNLERPFTDLRSVITPKSNFKNRTFYQPVPYPQVFGKNFAPNLSVIDLIMNEGPNATSVIRQSARSV